MSVLWLILIGFAAGCISGMGIGGGAILIPVLTFFFAHSQHSAQNINLIYFIPTASIAIFAHTKNDLIEKKILPKTIIGGCVGAVLGAIIALHLGGDTLKRFFAIFLLVMGVYEFFRKD